MLKNTNNYLSDEQFDILKRYKLGNKEIAKYFNLGYQSFMSSSARHRYIRVVADVCLRVEGEIKNRIKNIV